ncbi:hypothetical protein CDV52_14540 [Haematobacter missouriensis]|nr:hypothetical protein CDV50_17075 [Haematobacter massiliensis]OWJ74424.1 hypothetical protein CDV49_19450 [Haematobacter genomosp. 1]OWJ75906.1 hypothetical protein CDV53_09250 [Haematobacter missouriensis]OWJ82416.1 hypothetical protein CDV52_14540 [Haematobacter missouriensis]OWJ83076.1 hypothetical protein CDV51_16835 [Haematobacter massiliensis]
MRRRPTAGAKTLISGRRFDDDTAPAPCGPSRPFPDPRRLRQLHQPHVALRLRLATAQRSDGGDRMIRVLRSTAFAGVLSLTAMTGASAQGVPTEDLRAIANAIQQLDQMKQQLQAMTGSRGISNLLNSVTDKETREAAESLSSIMDGAIGGSPIGGNASVLTDKIDDLKETFALPNLDQFLGSDLPQDRAIATQAGAGMVAMATAEDTYTRSNAAMGRVNTLIDRIDSNADMKASVDFNSRMLAEVAVLLNENLRVQAAIANTMGSDALTAARDRASQRNFLQGSNEGQ